MSRNESGRFGALKSDSTHHFFRNAYTRSLRSLQFSVFRLLTDFVCLYTYEFWLSFWKTVRSPVILILPLYTACFAGKQWNTNLIAFVLIWLGSNRRCTLLEMCKLAITPHIKVKQITNDIWIPLSICRKAITTTFNYFVLKIIGVWL